MNASTSVLLRFFSFFGIGVAFASEEPCLHGQEVCVRESAKSRTVRFRDFKFPHSTVGEGLRVDLMDDSSYRIPLLALVLFGNIFSALDKFEQQIHEASPPWRLIVRSLRKFYYTQILPPCRHTQSVPCFGICAPRTSH